MGTGYSNERRLQYFKSKIKAELEKLRTSIGELRYSLYISMVDQCYDYDELKEMAELEMQIELAEYTKEAITEKLKEKSVDIKDLRKVCYPPYNNIEEEDVEDDELQAEGNDQKTAMLLALALSKRLEMEPLNERGIVFEPGSRLGEGIEEEDEEDDSDDYFTETDEDDSESEDEDIDEYFSDTDEDEQEDDYDDTEDNSNSEDINDDSDDEYFIESEDKDSENKLGGNEDVSENNDEDDEYFIDSSDEDTSENENSENEDDSDDYFVPSDSEDEEDSQEESGNKSESIFIEAEDEEAEYDEYFLPSDDASENEDETNEDETSDDEDYFVETDEDSDTEETEDDEDDYFIETDEGEDNESDEDEDDYFIETDEDEDSEESSDDDDDYFTDTDEDNDADEEQEEEDELDDYFMDGYDGTNEVAIREQQKQERLERKGPITPTNVFVDPSTQRMFNFLYKGITEATKVTQHVADNAGKKAENVGKKVLNSDMFKLEKDDED